jgi:hypothetical protein
MPRIVPFMPPPPPSPRKWLLKTRVYVSIIIKNPSVSFVSYCTVICSKSLNLCDEEIFRRGQQTRWNECTKEKSSLMLQTLNKRVFIEEPHSDILKVPQCEIFDRSDFHNFKTIKPLWVGDFGDKI